MTESDSVEPSFGAPARCPVCVGQSYVSGKIPGWGEWLRCRHCSLEFVDPLQVGDDPIALYQAAYLGDESRSGMDDYARRLRKRKATLSEISLWERSPVCYEIIEWLNLRIRKGKTVLELGCALGFFLHALRDEGFKAVGLDVAETPVMLNRRDGFDVWHGPLESMPDDWVQPDVVVSLFVLHHLDDPMEFLRDIRDRWPVIPLVLAIRGPSILDAHLSSPPRTLTRWNGQAVSEALTQAGYMVRIREIPSVVAYSRILNQMSRSFAWLITVPLIYRAAKRLANVVLPKILKPQHGDANVILVFAEPRQD